MMIYVVAVNVSACLTVNGVSWTMTKLQASTNRSVPRKGTVLVAFLVRGRHIMTKFVMQVMWLMSQSVWFSQYYCLNYWTVFKLYWIQVVMQWWFSPFKNPADHYDKRIIIGSDRRPETKQGIEGKIDRFRLGRVRVRDRVRVRYNWSPIWTRSPIWTYQFLRLLNSDRWSEPNAVHDTILSQYCIWITVVAECLYVICMLICC